jgi:thiamine-phosphate pyrophosphorylase
VNGELTAALRLVAITDNLRDGIEGLLARAAAAVSGGATMVQVRLKEADTRTLVDVTRRFVQTLSVPVVVNDRVDVALVAGAAGVHLGADDLPVGAARAIAPAGFIIGASLGSENEALNASAADYAGIGPAFPTQTKGDAGAAVGVGGLVRLAALVRIPCVGIGGITAANARAVADAGLAGVAVVSAIMGSNDPAAAARAMRVAMES